MVQSRELSQVGKDLQTKGKVSEPCWTRTSDPLLKRQMLYQAELTALKLSKINPLITRNSSQVNKTRCCDVSIVDKSGAK